MKGNEKIETTTVSSTIPTYPVYDWGETQFVPVSFNTNWIIIPSKLKVKRLSPSAVIPSQAKEGDVCFDLYSNRDMDIISGHNTLIPTGIAIELPDGFEGLIRPRSSTSRRGIQINLGTIDNGYRGEIFVSATMMDQGFGNYLCKVCYSIENEGKMFVHICDRPIGIKIKKGERIAQLAIRYVPKFIIEEVDSLTETERGNDSFGSSGK